MSKKRCCNPLHLNNHKWITRKLAPVSSSLRKKFPDIGNYICFNCRMKIYYRNDIPSTSTTVGEENVSDNIVLEELSEVNNELSNESKDESLYIGDIAQELLHEIKQLVHSASCASDKIKYLTMTPRSWSIRNLQRNFDISYRMARKAKELQEERGFGSSPDPRPSRMLSVSVISQVVEFYYTDEISRILPGKKDFVTVRDANGTKKQIQKRLILCNLKEAYAAFKIQKPDVKIGFTKFAQHRPKECILAGPAGTHTVCVCKIHQNVKLMLAGVNSISRSFKRTYHELLAQMICASPTPACHLGECKNCPNADTLIKEIECLFDDNFVENISYNRWTHTDRSNLENITTTVEEFIATFKDQLINLKTHDFIAKQQSAYLQYLKNNLQPGEFVVLCDFSENYAFVVQDEIQSFHWNNNQATIHPFVIYYRENNNLEHISYVIISEDLHHNTVAVHIYQRKLIKRLKEKFGQNGIKKLIYFTDGASAQYKNKSNFINITHHKEDFNIEAEWHFFASSHGKSPCDGIGGTVKRFAARASLQRPTRNYILTAAQLYEWAISSLKNITFDYCSTHEYEKGKKKLECRFQKAMTIQGTRQFHAIIPISKSTIKCKIISCWDQSITRKIMR